jgi:hypothetical protein
MAVSELTDINHSNFEVRFLDSFVNAFNKYDDNFDKLDFCRYFDVTELTDLNSSVVNDISLLHINIRSLKANFDSLERFLNSVNYCFDVVVITESWLDSNLPLSFLIKGYNLFSFPRDVGRGGGICFYIREKFNVVDLSDKNLTSYNTFEHAVLSVSSENFCSVISAVYRPPNGPISNFLLEFESYVNHVLMLTNSSNYCKYSTILGDFNINLLHTDTVGDTSLFLDLMYGHGFFPTIFRPTRITNHSSTLIDNIFVNTPNYLSSGLIYYDMSDHLPIFVTLQSFKNHTNANNPYLLGNKNLYHRKFNSIVYKKNK